MLSEALSEMLEREKDEKKVLFEGRPLALSDRRSAKKPAKEVSCYQEQPHWTTKKLTTDSSKRLL